MAHFQDIPTSSIFVSKNFMCSLLIFSNIYFVSESLTNRELPPNISFLDISSNPVMETLDQASLTQVTQLGNIVLVDIKSFDHKLTR